MVESFTDHLHESTCDRPAVDRVVRAAIGVAAVDQDQSAGQRAGLRLIKVPLIVTGAAELRVVFDGVALRRVWPTFGLVEV